MQEMKDCKVCGKPTVHVGPGTSHIFHLIMTIITWGFWIPIWIIQAVTNPLKRNCSTCGTLKTFQ